MRARRNRLLLILIPALCVALLSAATIDSSGVGAATHHVAHHHKTKHHHKAKHPKTKHHKAKHRVVAKKKPVPSCPGFGKFSHQTSYPLTDDRSEQKGLVPAIDKLDCSAADHSTIDIKSWYIHVQDAAMTSMVSHLALMSKYHHVRVNVGVGSNAYNRKELKAFKKAFAFAHIYICPNSCYEAQANNISHSKWITVSRLRLQNESAVLSLSANWARQQFVRTRQTGILTIGHPALYNAFVRRYSVYQSCALYGNCTHVRPALQWTGSPGAYVYFAPGTPGVGDPVSQTLDAVRCTAGSFVDVTSLVLTRTAVIKRLVKLRRAGCQVRVLLEHAVTASMSSSLAPRCEWNHDKSMLIETANIHEVIAGTEDFGGAGIYSNDNEMVMTTAAGTRSTFEQFFNQNWSAGATCKVTHATTAQLRKVREN